MAKIKPFSGLYYYNKYSKANNVSKFVNQALNFDYYAACSNFGSGFGGQNELNVANLQNFNMPNEVNGNLKNWLESGTLTVSGGSAFYVCEMSYRILDRAYRARGFFAIMDLSENNNFHVEKLDISSEEGSNLVSSFLNKVNIQTSPIFALYDDNGCEISSILKEMCEGQCFERAKHFNVSYKVFEVTNESLIEKLKRSFEQVNKIYLSGGAEVYDAVLKNNQKSGVFGNCVLSFFMEKSSEAVAVLPVHRIISMSLFDLDDSLEKLSPYFDVIECGSLNFMRNKMFGLSCEGKRAFGLYCEETFWVLALSDESKIKREFLCENSIKSTLDSFIVDELILQKVLNLNDFCVQFSSSASCAKAAVDCGDGCFAVFLNAPRLSDLTKVIESGETLTQKAAHIFPRPVDGLVFYSG